MKNSYHDLVHQAYEFPQEGFHLENGYLHFYDLSLEYLIKKYGTPFRLMYLPRIRQQIARARSWFANAMAEHNYTGKYFYSYCTKCCHFSHVVKAALQEKVQLETSSSFDIDLILRLHQQGKVPANTIIIHNGHKTPDYLRKVMLLREAGFVNSMIVLDSLGELRHVRRMAKESGKVIKIGLRMAMEQEPQSAYYTSRLGIPGNEILDVYLKEIKVDKHLSLKMLHFFVDAGIKDNFFYWGEFQKALKLFIELKKVDAPLTSLNLGGGFPIRNKLNFSYDYQYMVNEMVGNIAKACRAEKVEEPDIFTEFGKFTVGESGATIFSIIEQKVQNESERWYMIDNSLMNTIPDAWSIFEKFILLPVNKWNNEFTRVNIGGLSCDQFDYYNSEDMNQQVHLPQFKDDTKEPLYIGFFHTGAYQDAISGYGGIKHCLIPSPRHIVVERNEEGELVDYLFKDEQSVDDMLEILGY